jgi:hypothetical protein
MVLARRDTHEVPKHVEVGLWDYARYGIPVTLLTTGAGMVVLLVLG